MLNADCFVRWRAAIAACALALGSCAKPAPPPPPAAAGPPYVFYYRDVAGIHRLDARSGADSLLLPAARPGIASAASPDRTQLAIGYSGTDSSRLVLVNVATGSVKRLHAASRAHRYTLAWAPDGARLAIGYFIQRRVGRETLPGTGQILIASLNSGLTRVDCEVSKMVYAWVAADTIVVGDGRAMYPVDISGCRGDAAIRLAGKRDVTFSPDRKRLFHYATARVRRGSRTVAATELYVGRYDGTGARRVIGDPYDPQRARWAPDGARIAFDVRPPGAARVRHIAVYDLGEERVRFFPSQTPDGTPTDTAPLWVGGDGWQLVHDRMIGARTQKILRTLPLDPSAVQMEPRVLVDDQPAGTTWGWAGDAHLVVVSERRVRLVHTDAGLVYEMPGGRTILHAATLPR